MTKSEIIREILAQMNAAVADNAHLRTALEQTSDTTERATIQRHIYQNDGMIEAYAQVLIKCADSPCDNCATAERMKNEMICAADMLQSAATRKIPVITTAALPFICHKMGVK